MSVRLAAPCRCVPVNSDLRPMLRCPQCDREVEAEARRCTHCPAVFTKPGGWRPASGPPSGHPVVSIGTWLLIVPLVLIGQVFRVEPLTIGVGCAVIFLVGLTNLLSKRRSMHRLSGAVGCLLALAAVGGAAVIAVISLAMLAAR